MTALLLRLFANKRHHTTESAHRARIGALSGVVGMVANVLLFAGKLIAGTLSGSVAITADAMNNLSDASSSVVTLVGFRLANKPADEGHPYGHARFEYLSGLAVAALIIVIGFELAKSSLDKIITPTAVDFSLLTGLILGGSILVKLWLALFNGKLGRLIGSQTLRATAQDSRNDCISTGAVLIAGLLQHFFGWRVDGWMGMAVAIFILYSGAILAKDTISPLLGEAASPELRQIIVEHLSENPKVLGYHDLMVHDYGPGQRFATLHVEMDQREDPLVCHELIDDLERECLQNHNIHLVIHYDPVVTDDPERDRLQAQALQVLRDLDPRLSIHDFRVVKGAGHTNLIFDIALPMDLGGQEKAIRAHLEAEMSKKEGTDIYAVLTFDPAVFNE